MASLLKEFGSDTFIGRYLRYARKVTDAPDVFHVGCALAALSSVFAPRTTMTGVLGGKPDPLNLWIGLVGDSGASRKSTCLNLVRAVLPDGEILWTDNVQKSVERSCDFFSRNREGIMIWGPCVSEVLPTLRKPGWAGSSAGLLHALRDGRTVTQHVAKRTIEIRDPRIALLTALTPSHLRSGTKRDPGNVATRMLWLSGKRTRTYAYPPAASVRKTERVFIDLAKLRRQSFDIPTVKVDWPAIAVAGRWIKSQPMRDQEMFARLPWTVLRAAALDVLGSCGATVYASDVEKMIRTIGPAMLDGMRLACGVEVAQ